MIKNISNLDSIDKIINEYILQIKQKLILKKEKHIKFILKIYLN